MRVSVIVPVYKASAYIEHCVTSLLEQTYNELEIIFVDDCSPDDSMDKLQSVLSSTVLPNAMNVKVLRHEHNRGAAAARATGLAEATGDYVIQVDSDDYVHPDYINFLVQAVTEGDGCDIAVCDMYNDYGGGKMEFRPNNPDEQPTECLGQVIEGSVHASLANKLIRRRIFTDHNIKPVEGIDMFDDKLLLFRVLYFTKSIKHLAMPLYYYNRTNEDSISSRLSIERTARCSTKQLIYIADFFSDKIVPERVRQAIVSNEINVLGLLVLNKFNDIIKRDSHCFHRYTMAQKKAQPVVSVYRKLAVLLYQRSATRWVASLLSSLYLNAIKK